MTPAAEAQALCDQAFLLFQEGRFLEAAALLRRAIELAPKLAHLHTNLGMALREVGKSILAAPSFRRAVELDPASAAFHSNLVYSAYFNPECGFEQYRDYARQWNRAHGEPLRHTIRPHANDRDPERRLKVGYVSPDFRSQAECYFVIPLLEAHDRDHFELHLYASVRDADDITDRYRRVAHRWHDVLALSNEALAAKIRDDQIDVLIDLTMHMADNRLPLFARRPAPVQVTWLAFPGTTGVTTFDARLTDAHMEPLGQDDSWSSEPPVRLPDAWCVYDPITPCPEVGPSPAAANGYVTFGSLNSFAKFNGAMLRVWSEVLKAAPASRLLLLCPDPLMHERVRAAFASAGVEPARIELLPRLPREKYLAMFNRIDIALDPWPINGMTTTLDGLWMGVPVLTLPGPTPASRCGLTTLNTLGLTEFVARDVPDLLRMVSELTPPRLSDLRPTLRRRMNTSRLMDAPRFAGNVEDVYRTLWRRWCERGD